MKYKTEFKVGDVVFFNWDNRFTKLVHLYNIFKYGVPGWAHTGIITKLDPKSIQIHEAIGKGFVKSWYTKEFIRECETKKILDIKRSTKMLSFVEFHADNYLGRKYGFLDLLGIAVSFLFKWRMLKITGAKRLICSEAVARILNDASTYSINFVREFKKSLDMITPQDLYLSKHLNFRRKL